MSQFYAKIKKVSLFIGFIYFMSHNSIKALFVKSKKQTHLPLIKEQLDNSAIAMQINANAPVEDRYVLKKFTSNKGGIMMAVFDGHGGDMLAQFAHERIYDYYLNEYANAPDCSSEEEKVVQALSKAIEKIEDEYYEAAIILYKEGKGRAATVGSCALISVVKDDRLYVANLGDSKAKMFSINAEQPSTYDVTNLSSTFNARKLFEQERLRREYTDDNIVVCRRSKVCYVKGRLQPTRSLGDFHLKYPDFNEHVLTNSNSSQYKKEIKGMTKPYISSRPDIKVFTLTPKDKWVLLASDGLWDYLKSRDVAIHLNRKNAANETIENISESLIHTVLTKSAEESKLTLEELLKIPPGRLRRNIHDDITLILLSLNNTKH